MSTTINYDTFVEKADLIAKYSNDMQIYMLEAYFKIGDMSNVWSEKFYNYYSQFCNTFTLVLNNLFALAVSTIPDGIYARARAYAGSEQIRISASYNVKTSIILKGVPKSNKGTKTELDQTAILEYKVKINDQFSKAMASGDSIINATKGVDWDQITSGSDVRKLVKLVGKIKEVIKMLSSGLDLQIDLQNHSIEDNKAILPETESNEVDETGEYVEQITAYQCQ